MREVGDCAFRLVDRLDDLDRALIENPAMFGRRQLARGAVEQAHAKVPLQLLDAVAGDGRRHPLVAAGGGKGAEFDDPDEDADVIEIGHDVLLPHCKSNDIGGDLIDFFESVGD